MSVNDELELIRLQESIARMTDIERELYLREGLSSLEVGKHISVTLSVAATLLSRRIDMLQRESEMGPSNLKFYYEQQIQPLTARLQETRLRIKALQYGDQRGFAWSILAPYHPLRNYSCFVVHSKWFQTTMTVMAVASCATLWIERPAMPEGESVFVDTANSIINLSFIAECLLKVPLHA